MSLISVWNELWTLIAKTPSAHDSEPVASLTEIRRVFKGEPIKLGYDPQRFVTITASGYADNSWLYWLRIQATVGERPIEDQLAVATTIDQLEVILDANNRFEYGDWDIGLTEDMGAWVATVSLPGPRER